MSGKSVSKSYGHSVSALSESFYGLMCTSPDRQQVSVRFKNLIHTGEEAFQVYLCIRDIIYLQVLLVENKYESISRVRKRILDANIQNVTLYQVHDTVDTRCDKMLNLVIYKVYTRPLYVLV